MRSQSFQCLIDGKNMHLHLIFMISGVEKHLVRYLNEIQYSTQNKVYSLTVIITACYCHRQHRGESNLPYNLGNSAASYLSANTLKYKSKNQ